VGKASCGWLGQRVGVVWSVVATEIATAALIVITCFTPITAMLVFLPFLGMVLNGTSSVLYGTVPELAPKGNTGRAFTLFYTGVIGAGGLAPIAYGAIADHSSRMIGFRLYGAPVFLMLSYRLVVQLVATINELRTLRDGPKATAADSFRECLHCPLSELGILSAAATAAVIVPLVLSLRSVFSESCYRF